MTHTAVAADEPEPEPSLAVGGFIPAGSVPLVGGHGCCDGYLPPNTAVTTASGSVVVTLTVDPGALRRAALEIAERLWPERPAA